GVEGDGIGLGRPHRHAAGARRRPALGPRDRGLERVEDRGRETERGHPSEPLPARQRRSRSTVTRGPSRALIAPLITHCGVLRLSVPAGATRAPAAVLLSPRATARRAEDTVRPPGRATVAEACLLGGRGLC